MLRILSSYFDSGEYCTPTELHNRLSAFCHSIKMPIEYNDSILIISEINNTYPNIVEASRIYAEFDSMYKLPDIEYCGSLFIVIKDINEYNKIDIGTLKEAYRLVIYNHDASIAAQLFYNKRRKFIKKIRTESPFIFYDINGKTLKLSEPIEDEFLID